VPRTHDYTGRDRKRSGDINAAPNTTTTRAYKRKNKIAGQFSWQLIEMLESPAWRVLSQSARRVLDRIEIELARHAGTDNGALVVTYIDFEQYGISRHCIWPAIQEVAALGFVEVTEVGRGGAAAEFRRPNKFRLTWLPTDNAPPTDEWRRIQTLEQAQEIARRARGSAAVKKQKPPPKSAPKSVQNLHLKAENPGAESALRGTAESAPLSISAGGGRSGAGRRRVFLPLAADRGGERQASVSFLCAPSAVADGCSPGAAGRGGGVGSGRGVRRPDGRARIVEILTTTGRPLSNLEIMFELRRCDRGPVDQLLAKMVQAGEIARVERGRYALVSGGARVEGSERGNGRTR
jgi:hypothetical protein